MCGSTTIECFAAASRVTDWSAMKVQLYNFHAAGVAARGRPGESAILPEPVGDRSATVKCRSRNRSRCIAPSVSCRFAHTCSGCGADHRASVCPGRAEKEVNKDPEPCLFPASRWAVSQQVLPYLTVF